MGNVIDGEKQSKKEAFNIQIKKLEQESKDIMNID